MKTTNNNLASKFALAVFLALGTLAVTSCQKDKSQTEEIIPDGKNQVIVRISGINEDENITINGSKSSTSAKKSLNQNSLKLVEGDGFDAIIGVDNNASSSSGLKAASGIRAATTPLASTTTYSIYFYKKVGATYTFVKSVPLTAAATGIIDLANGSYKWFAISYNNTEVLPVGANLTTVPTNTLLDINKDVLVASSTSDLVINGNTVPLNILFNRVFSDVTVEVNTLGMFAPMTTTPTISVTGPTFTKTINFTDGKLDLTPSTALNLTTANNNFANEVGVVGDSYKKIATFRTAGQTNELTVNAKVSQLKIKLDDGTTRDFLATQSNQDIEFIPTGGKKQRLLVGIAESALTFGSGATAVKWSRSNLYYAAGDATPYRFYHTNQKAATFDPRAYFAQGGVIPGKLALRSAQKDPCALVYPKGLWRTPTYDDIAPLTNREGVITDLLGNIVDVLLPTQLPGASFLDGEYIQYVGVTGKHAAYGSITDAANASNNLRFNYNGLVAKVSTVNRLVTISLGSTFGNQAAFWTNSTVTNHSLPSLLDLPVLNIERLVSLGAWSYIGSDRAPLLPLNSPKRAIAAKGLGVLDNLTLAGAVEVLNSDLMNVRCVRVPDATWTALSKAPGYNPMPDLTNIND